MIPIYKGIQEEKAILRALLNKQEVSIRKAFETFIKDATSEETIKQVTELISRNRIEEALALIDIHIRVFGNILPKVFMDVAYGEVASLASAISKLKPTLTVSFDPTNSRAIDLMNRSRLNLITDISSKQRAAIRQILTDSFRRGLSPKESADRVKRVIGLTPYQVNIVSNYKKLLETGSREALNRELRNTRFDETVENAINKRKALTTTQINRMVEAFRRNQVAERAYTLSRTESLSTFNEARDEGLQQSLDITGLSKDRVERVWNTTIDGRQRDTHDRMNKQIRGVDEAFESPSGATLMYPGDRHAPVRERINCRCVLTLRFK